MVSRKRAAAEMEESETKPETSLIQRIRNMWHFASLMQYIYIFGKVVKIDEEFDIEDLEAECLRPTPSEKLSEIGLALLKYVSSHKGLTPEIFDEYTRRQFVAKAPERNPFGVEEEPNKFAEFDIFTKLRVLHQLSVWTLGNPDRIREKMAEIDETSWRIEPLGWDAEDRAYIVLDDNRLYRKTDAPLPPPPRPKSKAKSKKRRSMRGSKRRKVAATEEESGAEDVDDTINDEETVSNGQEDDGFGGMKWECIAITLPEYQDFLESIRRTRDPNQKYLHERIVEDVLPVIEKREEELERKRMKQLRDLENQQKLATAKRSSRLAVKQERRKEIEEEAEAERKRLADLAMARKEQERQQKMEQERQSRMMTREQRLKEREVKRILHEEELQKLEEEKKKVDSNEARLSERHLKAEMERRQKELEKLTQDEDWVFDCSVCGVYGENLDDGSHSIACEKCSVWQHSACHKIAQADAERDDFHFVCEDCKKKAEDEKKAKLPPLKIRLGASASPNAQRTDQRRSPIVQIGPTPNLTATPSVRPTSSGSVVMNGPSLSPQGQGAGPPGAYQPPIARTGGYMFPPSMEASVTPPLPPPSQHQSPPPTLTHIPTMPAYARPRSSHSTQSSPTQPNAGHAPNMPGHAIPQSHLMDRSSPNPAGQPYWTAPSPHTNGVPQSQQSFTAYHQLEYPNHSAFQRRTSQGSIGSRLIHHDPFRNSFERVPGSSPTLPPTSVSPATPNGVSRGPFPPPSNSVTPRPPSQGRGPPSPSKPVATPLHQQSPYHSASSPRAVLPGPTYGLSPEKHDAPRPTSSQSISGTPLLPPPSLSPTTSLNILTPPVKNPTPDRSHQYVLPPPTLNAYANGANGAARNGN